MVANASDLLSQFADEAAVQAAIDYPADLRAKYRRYATRHEAEMQQIRRARQVADELQRLDQQNRG